MSLPKAVNLPFPYPTSSQPAAVSQVQSKPLFDFDPKSAGYEPLSMDEPKALRLLAAESERQGTLAMQRWRDAVARSNQDYQASLMGIKPPSLDKTQNLIAGGLHLLGAVLGTREKHVQNALKNYVDPILSEQEMQNNLKFQLAQDLFKQKGDEADSYRAEALQNFGQAKAFGTQATQLETGVLRENERNKRAAVSQTLKGQIAEMRDATARMLPYLRQEAKYALLNEDGQQFWNELQAANGDEALIRQAIAKHPEAAKALRETEAHDQRMKRAEMMLDGDLKLQYLRIQRARNDATKGEIELKYLDSKYRAEINRLNAQVESARARADQGIDSGTIDKAAIRQAYNATIKVVETKVKGVKEQITARRKLIAQYGESILRASPNYGEPWFAELSDLEKVKLPSLEADLAEAISQLGDYGRNPESQYKGPPGKADAGRNPADRAQTFLDAPYVRGGSSSRGIDCSGLTQQAYASIGIKIPRTAAEQFMKGKVVDPEDLRPGDLIFHRNTNPRSRYYRVGQISHVQMYMGGDQVIEASSRAKRVVVSKLPKNAAGIRRF